MSALHVLRTCLGSHVRHKITWGVALPAVAPRRLPNARSFTSDRDKGKENETAAVDEQNEKAATDDAKKPEADDMVTKLQAKQDEIVELTVRPLFYAFR